MALDNGFPGPACLQHPHVPAARTCDRCGGPFCDDCLVPLRGQTLCGACKHASLSGAFQSYQVTVPTRMATAPQELMVPAPTAPLNSPCALHEHRAAVAVCERCGDFICLLCLTPFEGRSYCLRCFDLLWDRGEIGSAKRKARWYEDAYLALVASMFSWCVCFVPFVSFLPAIAAVVVASLTLSRRKQDLKTPERVSAIGAIVLAVLAAAVSVALWVSIFSK